MSELDLLTLALATTSNEISYFSQMITITFVVAIYYFLNQARIAMKLFAYVAFLIGMMLLFGQMLLETNLKVTLLQTLAAMPHQSAVTSNYVALYGTWLATVNAVLFNGAIWVLCLGTFYLLFFWKKSPEERDVTIKRPS